MTNEPYVQIVDSGHPHYPETGWFTGEVITMKFGSGTMAKLRLDHCKHGTDACFVSPGQIREIPAPGSQKKMRRIATVTRKR